MADKIIYLDNAATTVVNEEVLDAFSKAKKLYFANPGSIHIPGQEAFRLLEKAREQILNTLGVPLMEGMTGHNLIVAGAGKTAASGKNKTTMILVVFFIIMAALIATLYFMGLI